MNPRSRLDNVNAYTHKTTRVDVCRAHNPFYNGYYRIESDVTMSQSAAVALASVQAQLRLHDRALGASSCGITIADARLPDMPLIYINDSFCRITGYDHAEVVGRNCRFLQGADRAQPALRDLRAALQAGRDSTVTLRNYRRDGTPFWNELFTSPIFDDSGTLTHFIGVQTDVTARVEAQNALEHERGELERAITQLRHTQAMLIHAEKMNALGQMVAGIAHEINNPLSFITSNLHSLSRTIDDVFATYDQLETLARADLPTEPIDALRRAADLDFVRDDTIDLLSASLEGLARVKSIVQNLRTFSRLDETELKLVSLAENISSTLLIAQGELRQIRVTLDVDQLPPINCYPAELNQVLLNLIVNAAQAMPAGGELAIRGENHDAEIVLTITDTGYGMTPDVQARIFEPFFTTKPVGQGTGLGLAIAYKIITDLHRGTLHVASQPGSGTTFTMQLPKDLAS